jgi:methylmalonyl-CoA/ethylmalonyl-CoA epimerase
LNPLANKDVPDPNRVGGEGSCTLVSERFDSLDFKLHHVGVAVSSLESTTKLLSMLFGYRIISGPFEDPIQRVTVIFLAKSNEDVAEIELIAPLTEDSPITSMLAGGRGGSYHLCFETSNIDLAIAHAKSNCCVIVSPPVPATAFQGRRIAWIYTPSEQLFELLEARTSTSL